MTPPFISYVTFNRLGLTERNLRTVLDTAEDFEMHIIDSNSKDDTWDFVQSLTDPRIKSRTRFPVNYGPIFPGNYNLFKRKPDQYFITLDSDVNIKTKNWISRFMEAFDAFPEVGLLGVPLAKPYPQYIPPVIPRSNNGVSYQQLKNGFVDITLDFVPGCCQCLRPELIQQIGYWSEENCYGDAELSIRVNNYTSFKAGFITSIEIDMQQEIPCDQCQAQQWCKLDRIKTTCFNIRDKYYQNQNAAKKFHKKYLDSFAELAQGKRTAYCASLYDEESIKNHFYHKEWVLENMEFFLENSN